MNINKVTLAGLLKDLASAKNITDQRWGLLAWILAEMCAAQGIDIHQECGPEPCELETEEN